MSELQVWFARYGGHFAVATSDAEANGMAERAGHWGLEWFAQAADTKLALWFTQGRVRAFDSISRADHVHATRYEKTNAEWTRILGKGVAQLHCPFIGGDERAVQWCASRIGLDLKPRRHAEPGASSPPAARPDALALLRELVDFVEEKDARGEPVIGGDHKMAVEFLLEFAERAKAALQ